MVTLENKTNLRTEQSLKLTLNFKKTTLWIIKYRRIEV